MSFTRCAVRAHVHRVTVVVFLVLQVGFLYLRYVCNPRELWTWFRKYVRDEEVSRGKGGG